MFTKKQMDEFDKYMETARVEDLETPDAPKFTTPNWLPIKVREVLKQKEEFLASQRHSQSRLFVDMWPHFVRYAQIALPAFTDPNLKEAWQELHKSSESATVNFARKLFKFGNDFDGAVTMYYKHKNEKICCEEMIQKAISLHETMEEYECHYYGHMLQDNHQSLMETLRKFWESSQKALNEFNEETLDASYLFSDYFPITREFHSEKALPVFFARKMTLFFYREFGKPKHKIVADFISAMFDVHYSENEIIKLAKRVKPLLKM